MEGTDESTELWQHFFKYWKTDVFLLKTVNEKRQLERFYCL